MQGIFFQSLFSGSGLADSGYGGGRLRRSTLVTLRWMACAGQALTLIVVAQVFGFVFFLWPCVWVIIFSVGVNLGVFFALPMDRRVGDVEAMCQLGFDLLQLAVLLYLTGGMNNPFALLFLAPVVTGALTLNGRVLVSLSGLAIMLSFLLLFYHQPLPWSLSGGMHLPFQYRIGIWSALVTGMAFTSLYAWYSALESRRMSQALAATEEVLAQEQKLSDLGSLTAAAAHELGTPLATIQLTAREMSLALARKRSSKRVLREDADLVLSQAHRCREILQNLAAHGFAGDRIHDELSLTGLLDEAAAPFLYLQKRIDIHVPETADRHLIHRQAELLYGLKNLIENAADFARSQVRIKGWWDDTYLYIHIEDDGKGFDAAILPRLGEPYVFQRKGRRGRKTGGLGLGIFIAKTLLMRIGGEVGFAHSLELGGAAVQLRWPKDILLIET